MGKPLLTDEIIERAKRGEKIEGRHHIDDEETKVIHLGKQPFGYASPEPRVKQDTLNIQVEPTVVKSRRIENEKRGLFQAKLNKILAVIVILLIALIAAMYFL